VTVNLRSKLRHDAYPILCDDQTPESIDAMPKQVEEIELETTEPEVCQTFDTELANGELDLNFNLYLNFLKTHFFTKTCRDDSWFLILIASY